MTSLDVISRKITEIKTVIECHSDLLGLINGRSVQISAQLETVLSVLQEVLAKHGVDKQASIEMCQEFMAGHLVAQQSANEQALRAAENTRLASAASPAAEKN
jgi:hypothetical protein